MDSTEVERLLTKFAGGRIPPLVPSEGKPIESGLLNGDLIKIYQRGFSTVNSIPLGVLAADEVWAPIDEKWSRANFRLNEHTKPHWASPCKEIRSKPVGDKGCEACDRRHAVQVEEARDVVAYLCDHGMIDFAAPVQIDGIVVAVLLAGQLLPAPNALWNAEFIQPDGLFRRLNSGEVGVAAFPEAKRRLTRAQDQLDLPQLKIENSFEQASKPFHIVGPDQTQTLMTDLRKAANQLTELATNTFQLQKARIVALLRARIAEALPRLTPGGSDQPAFWASLAGALPYVSRYFGCDFACIFRVDKPACRLYMLAAASGEGSLPTGVEGLPLGNPEARVFQAILEAQERPTHFATQPLLPLLEALFRRPAGELQSRAAVIAPAGSFEADQFFVVFGNLTQDFPSRQFSEIDQKALGDLLQSVSMVTRVGGLVFELEATAQRRDAFLQAVAHDIRNPIHNIVIKASHMRKPGLAPKEVILHAKKIATQVKRLNRLSERVWTLDEIARGAYRPDQISSTRVRLFDIVSECRDSLSELAESREVKVEVDFELQTWPSLILDPRLTTQAVLNLMDNAVKYSARATEVRVFGRASANTRTIIVSNRGLRIDEEDYLKIFDKYYRTNHAQVWVQDGTGIGLSIVKTFADVYGGVQVKSEPIPGTPDWKTEFSVTIILERH